MFQPTYLHIGDAIKGKTGFAQLPSKQKKDALTAPLIWLDASDTDTMYTDTSGTTLANLDDDVAAWECKGTRGGLYTQSNTGTRPIRKSNGLLLGSGDYLTGTPVSNYTDQIVVIAVVEFNSFSSYGAFLIGQHDGASNGSFYLAASLRDTAIPVARFMTVAGGSRTNTDGTTDVGTTQTRILTGHYSSANRIRLDGTEEGANQQSGTINSYIGVDIFIGKYANDTNWNTGGLIKELRVYTADDLPDLDAVETELANKWGVTLS